MAPFGRFTAYLRLYRGRMAAAVLLIMMVAGINLAMLWVVRRLVDLVLVARNPSALTMVILELGLLFFVQGLFAMGHSYLTATIGQHVVTDLRIQLFAHLETLSLGFFSRRRTGELMSRLMNDVSASNMSSPTPRLIPPSRSSL